MAKWHRHQSPLTSMQNTFVQFFSRSMGRLAFWPTARRPLREDRFARARAIGTRHESAAPPLAPNEKHTSRSWRRDICSASDVADKERHACYEIPPNTLGRARSSAGSAQTPSPRRKGTATARRARTQKSAADRNATQSGAGTSNVGATAKLKRTRASTKERLRRSVAIGPATTDGAHPANKQRGTRGIA